MSIIAWIVLGLIAGFFASKLVNKTGEDIVLDIGLGIVGAVVGGFVFNQLGAVWVTGFNTYSMLVAVIGAVLVVGDLPCRDRATRRRLNPQSSGRALAGLGLPVVEPQPKSLEEPTITWHTSSGSRDEESVVEEKSFHEHVAQWCQCHYRQGTIGRHGGDWPSAESATKQATRFWTDAWLAQAKAARLGLALAELALDASRRVGGITRSPSLSVRRGDEEAFLRRWTSASSTTRWTC